ncbi:MAG: NTP transferase domain-containing protein [Patescibacteria group bacterium]|nr:NTP transferase domain-containing protein [Patescibacteria group bacterium]
MNIQVIILAAGHGKRMKSETPKALTLLNRKPLINHVLEAVKKSEVCNDPIIVIGLKGDQVRNSLGQDYKYAIQDKQLGTGHAVISASSLYNEEDVVLVLYADHPLISAKTIKSIIETHKKERATITMATTIVPDFNDWRQGFINFGRFVRDEKGEIIKIVEAKDATEEEKEIKEVNPAYMCFDAKWMWSNLKNLKNNNTQEEYYLTDLTGMAFNEDKKISSIQINPQEALGVNNKKQLELVEKLIVAV